MSGLRICMVTTFYPPYSFGGDAVAIQRLARSLVRRGHHVTVIHDVDAFLALHRGPEPVVTDPGDGVEVVRLRSGLGLASPLLTQQLGHPVANGRRIREHLRRGNYDVVNFHNISLVGGPGILRYGGDAVTLYMAHDHWLVCPMHALWRRGRERCTGRQCVRCSLHYRRPPQLWRYTGLLERAMQSVDVVIAMSEFSRNKHEEFGFTRPMEVLPSFLPGPEVLSTPGEVQPSPHPRPYFFFAGRLERIKGLDDVIPVFRNYPDADLLIAGAGEHAAHLRAAAAGMPNVSFLGALAPRDLDRYYRHAIATLVPSVCFETFGIVLIESLRQRTPVIARRLGPFPEMVRASSGGELFDTSDELVAIMRRLQSDAAHRRRLGEAGYRASMELWGEEAVVSRYLDLVRAAAERRQHRRVLDALAA
jgi:glycosyltransferase involved in cell wall biosynthesis